MGSNHPYLGSVEDTSKNKDQGGSKIAKVQARLSNITTTREILIGVLYYFVNCIIVYAPLTGQKMRFT